jgi:hypothetical protein
LAGRTKAGSLEVTDEGNWSAAEIFDPEFPPYIPWVSSQSQLMVVAFPDRFFMWKKGYHRSSGLVSHGMSVSEVVVVPYLGNEDVTGYGVAGGILYIQSKRNALKIVGRSQLGLPAERPATVGGSWAISQPPS